MNSHGNCYVSGEGLTGILRKSEYSIKSNEECGHKSEEEFYLCAESESKNKTTEENCNVSEATY